MTTTRTEARKILRTMYPELAGQGQLFILSKTRIAVVPVYDTRPTLAWRRVTPGIVAYASDQVAIGQLLPGGDIDWDWKA